MGQMEKIWMQFPTAFWTNDLTNDWIGYIGQASGRWLDTLNLYKFTQKPELVMFNTGESAVYIQGLSDEQAVAEAMVVIRKMYPDAPNPVNYRRSNWGKDPYSMGSYPYLKPGAS